jgi:hypothetical protein
MKLRSVLSMESFEVAMADDLLFIKKSDEQNTYILVHVDDGIVVGRPQDTEDAIKMLQKYFKIRRLGPATFFLGLEIRNRGAQLLWISQQTYAKKIIEAADKKRRKGAACSSGC